MKRKFMWFLGEALAIPLVICILLGFLSEGLVWCAEKMQTPIMWCGERVCDAMDYCNRASQKPK